MMRGIPRVEYEQGIIYSIVLLLISAIVSAPHSPVSRQSKPLPTFQTVNSKEGLCIIFPQGTKETEQSEK